MVVRARLPWLAVPAVAVALACGKTPQPARENASARSAGGVSTVGGVAATDCPKTGHWSSCQVKRRLEQAGVAPRMDSSHAEVPQIGPPPMVYLVGTAPLAVFLFPDSVARARATAGLDTTKFVAPGTPLTMRGETTVIQNDNLLALLYSRNDHQRERVSDALTAGPPQP